MRLSMGNTDKCGDIAAQVHLRVDFHRAFVLAEFRPRA